MPTYRLGVSLLVLALFSAGCRSGKIATIDFSDGSYHGEVDKEGRKDGKGVYRWNDGSSYEGDFRENDRHGQGTFLWNNGESYKGDYFGDERTGKGIYAWPDGSSFQGSFLKGMRHGKGTFVSADGSVYEGDWFNDLQHGEGTLNRADGTIVDGIWRNGKLVTPPSNLPDKAPKPKVRLGWKESARLKEPVSASEFPHRQIMPPEERSTQTENSNWAKPTPPPASPGETPASQTPSLSESNAGAPATADQAQVNKGSTPAPTPEEEPSTPRPEVDDAPPVAAKATGDDENLWEGNWMEAEKEFVTYLIDGVDTIFHKNTRSPFTGKMRVLDAGGTPLGELELLNGRMHGEEVFFGPDGSVSTTQVWSRGKRTR